MTPAADAGPLQSWRTVPIGASVASMASLPRKDCALTIVLLVTACGVDGPAPHAAMRDTVHYHEEWARERDDYPTAYRALVLSEPCGIWLLAGSVTRWSCAGDSLGALPTGEGPGETVYPTTASRWGEDSVAVWDERLRRLTIFASGGSFGRTMPLAFDNVVDGRLTRLLTASGQRYVWLDAHPDINHAWTGQERSTLRRLGRGPALGDSLLSLPAPGSVVVREEMTFSRIDAPVRHRPLVAVLSDGSIVTGSTRSDALRFHRDTDSAVTVVLGLPRHAVSAEDRRKYRDSIVSSFELELAAQRLGAELEALFRTRATSMAEAADWPAERQLIDGLVPAGTGAWVLVAAHDSSRTRSWLVLDADGSIRHAVRVPHRGAVAAAAVRGETLVTWEFLMGEERGFLATYAP